MEQPTIIVCNDDGYYAEGLRRLREALKPLGRVITVAPSQDCSGVSQKITLHTALRLRKVNPDFYTVNGTPVDCVHLALHGVLEGKKPDLLVSGINHGMNVGEDITYSGTVAAAYEAFIHGIPALAISAGPTDKGFSLENAQRLAHQLSRELLGGDTYLRRAVWNVNVPGGALKGIKLVRLDKRSFQSSVVKRVDPRGKPYYWIGPYFPEFTRAADTDYEAYQAGYVAMTPLKVEMTNFEILANGNPGAEVMTRVFQKLEPEA